MLHAASTYEEFFLDRKSFVDVLYLSFCTHWEFIHLLRQLKLVVCQRYLEVGANSQTGPDDIIWRKQFPVERSFQIFWYIVKGSLDEKLPSYEVLKMLKE